MDTNIETLSGFQALLDQSATGQRVTTDALRPMLVNHNGKEQPVVFINGKPRLVGNALLREDEFKQVDEEVVGVAQETLNAVQDLRDRDLTFNAGDLGTTLSQYDLVNDTTGNAQIDMDPRTHANNDTVTYTRKSVPIPVIHTDFQLPLRRILESRQTGEAVETTRVAHATRDVSETLEDLLLNGSNAPVLNGNTIEGYTNATNRTTGSLTAKWDSQTGTDIIGDVSSMIQDLVDNNMAGPSILYIPTNYVATMGEDYKAESGMTVRERILQFPQIVDVKQADKLANDTVVLVRMARTVIDMAEVEDIQTIQWESGNGFTNFFMVMAAMAPRVKSDNANQSGIVVYSG